MNLTKAEKVRLGTFVAVGATLFLGAVLSLAGLKVWERRDYYKTRFHDNVSGLERSAQVKYQGLRVGRVEGMRVAPDDPSAIEVDISLEAGTALYEGTTAVLDMSGITGLKTINLTAGDPRKPKLVPGTDIPAGQSLLDKITGSAEQIATKVELVTNQVAHWTGDDNRRRFETLLDSLNKLTKDLDRFVVDTRAPLVAALEETAKTGATLRTAATKSTDVMDEMQKTLATARGSIAETQRLLAAIDAKDVAGTVGSARSAMAKLDTRLSDAELGAALTNLRGALANLTKLLQEMDLAVRASREDFVTSLATVRQATEDLREFSRLIAQDPSVLIRGREAGE